ncbi:hypothetical protein JHS3_10570 [Jeongeupia sp. HS-3]|nr:hypothetical protein JHS3_10570 [Jeongeupia sp. HS-3]
MPVEQHPDKVLAMLSRICAEHGLFDLLARIQAEMTRRGGETFSSVKRELEGILRSRSKVFARKANLELCFPSEAKKIAAMWLDGGKWLLGELWLPGDKIDRDNELSTGVLFEAATFLVYMTICKYSAFGQRPVSLSKGFCIAYRAELHDLLGRGHLSRDGHHYRFAVPDDSLERFIARSALRTQLAGVEAYLDGRTASFQQNILKI